MDIIITLFQGLVIVSQAIYTVLYTLFGPGMYLLFLGYILYWMYPRSIILQYMHSRFSQWVSPVTDEFPVDEYEKQWLEINVPIAIQKAIAEGDLKTAREIKKLARYKNKEDLFDFVVDYLNVDVYGE